MASLKVPTAVASASAAVASPLSPRIKEEIANEKGK